MKIAIIIIKNIILVSMETVTVRQNFCKNYYRLSFSKELTTVDLQSLNRNCPNGHNQFQSSTCMEYFVKIRFCFNGLKLVLLLECNIDDLYNLSLW